MKRGGHQPSLSNKILSSFFLSSMGDKWECVAHPSPFTPKPVIVFFTFKKSFRERAKAPYFLQSWGHALQCFFPKVDMHNMTLLFVLFMTHSSKIVFLSPSYPFHSWGQSCVLFWSVCHVALCIFLWLQWSVKRGREAKLARTQGHKNTRECCKDWHDLSETCMHLLLCYLISYI